MVVVGGEGGGGGGANGKEGGLLSDGGQVTLPSLDLPRQ